MNKISYMGEFWNIVTVYEKENGVMYYILESDDGELQFEVSKRELNENP